MQMINMKMGIEDLLALEGFEYISGPARGDLTGVYTDSRDNILNGAFLCLSGERFDGTDFIPQAIQKGVKMVIGESAKIRQYECTSPQVTFAGVENPLYSYGAIARWWRKKRTIPVVLITGSVGKTTVKEMFTQILQNKLQIVTNYKNENNEIGVPRTLLKINEATEVVIIEAGMNHAGELDRIASYCLPDYVVMTPICEAHVGMLGSLDNIVQAKAEVLSHLSQNGICFVMNNAQHISVFKQKFKGQMVTIGESAGSDYQLLDVRRLFTEVHLFTYPFHLDIWAQTPQKTLNYTLRSPNAYDALNSLAVLAVLDTLKVIDRDEILSSFQKFTNIDLRSRMKIIADILFWVDCYNANPTSMKAALDNFFQVECLGKRVLVLGEMKELGRFSREYHAQLGKHLAGQCRMFQEVVFFGPEMKWAQEHFYPRSMCSYFEDIAELSEFLLSNVSQGDAVFLKGSRSNHLEEILRYFLIKKECFPNDY